jgi:molybdopterin molybdotransferase
MQTPDHCAQPELMSVENAILKIQQAIQPVVETEVVDLLDALDRVLAETVFSAIDVPSYDNSAMDGYALCVMDDRTEFKVIGQSLAGHAFSGELEPGECIRIMTGAVVPAGANAVVMQEQVSVADSKIFLNIIAKPGDNIRKAGEDLAKGNIVLKKSHRITPVDIGLLASLGVSRLTVFRRLRVAILSTGDELTPITEPLKPGNIYDSNRYVLHALLKRLNVEIIDAGLIADDYKKIDNAIQNTMAVADVIITSGGVSVGDADYTKQVLMESGEINFWKIAMKPGKPFAFGKLGKGYFFGLPGNPVSAVVTYHQLVLPGLRRMAGEIFSAATSITAVAADALKKQPGRKDFQRGILSSDKQQNLVKSTGMQSSGMLSSMAKANCYILLDAERGSVKDGESVEVLPFDKFIL